MTSSTQIPANVLLHDDRLLPQESGSLKIARDLLHSMQDLPIVSPHGHVPAHWFRPGFRFKDATDLLIRPDHYLLRMMASQGHRYEDLGVAGTDNVDVADARSAFRTFAANYHLFLGTSSRLWLDHALHDVLAVPRPLDADTADWIFDFIGEKLTDAAFSPRQLYMRFGIEVLATTDAATDELAGHRALREDDDWQGNIIPTFRPDAVTDPEHPDFMRATRLLAEQTGRDCRSWGDYLAALQDRRDAFKALGAKATDHGFATPETVNLPEDECQDLLQKAMEGRCTRQESAKFRAQMLFEMTKMSTRDGLVMQIHAGSWRNYAPGVLHRFGLDKGYDIPMRTNWAQGLKPVLDAFGFHPNLHLVLFTLDESAYGRELAPLAGAFPVLRLGAPWWFFDSPLGLSRHFDAVVETAGFWNLSGFVDDTRALLSVPGRHDVYRRCVASKLATMVGQKLISKTQAEELCRVLCLDLPRQTYRLD
jgi:glucuronate isomerase